MKLEYRNKIICRNRMELEKVLKLLYNLGYYFLGINNVDNFLNIITWDSACYIINENKLLTHVSQLDYNVDITNSIEGCNVIKDIIKLGEI